MELLRRQPLYLIAGYGLTALLTIAYLVYVGRAVGPSEYSDFAAALSMIHFVGLALSPLTPTVARLTARYESRGDRETVARLRGAVLRRVAIIGGTVAAIGAALSPLLSDAMQFHSAAVLPFAFAAVFVFSLTSVDRGVAHGLLRFSLYNANTVVEAAVRIAAVIIGFAMAREVWVAVASYVLALTVAEVLLAVPLARTLPAVRERTVDWNEVKRLTLPLVVLMFSLAVFQNADMLVVKRWFDPSAAGFYGAAAALARGFAVVVVPFYVMAGPVLTALHEAGRPVFRATVALTGASMGLAIVLFAVLIVGSEPLVRLMYGPAFVAAAPLVVPLGALVMITYAGLMLSQALVTLHDFRFLAGYAVAAVAQIVALILFHDDYAQVLTSLFVCQSAAVLVVAVFFVKAWRR